MSQSHKLQDESKFPDVSKLQDGSKKESNQLASYSYKDESKFQDVSEQNHALKKGKLKDGIEHIQLVKTTIQYLSKASKHSTFRLQISGSSNALKCVYSLTQGQVVAMLSH